MVGVRSLVFNEVEDKQSRGDAIVGYMDKNSVRFWGMVSRNLSSIYIAVFAFIEERRCQIMIGLWQYVISEMGFEVPRLKCHVALK